jgi:ABC-type branched-subunit amino acid transport system ATPase component/ABC-type branched-subunit amino acid transport system permease subunit
VSTLAQLANAVRDARATWTPRTTVAWAAFGIASLAPLVVGDARTADLADGLYLAVAAVGLAFAVGIAGLPSLAQGAFIAIGAVVGARLVEVGIPTIAAAPAAAIAGGLAAAATGAAFGRLPRAGFAAATWIVSWLVAAALDSLTWPLGGAQGVVVTAGPSTTGHYELALALTAMSALGFLALARSPVGLRLAAARDREAAANELGIPVARLRIAAVAASGAVAGLSGALAVELAGVGDPSRYDSYLSFKLFVVVLIGGALAPLGAPVGVVVLGALSIVADAIGRLEHVAEARSHTLLAAIMLLGVVSLGWDGLVRPPRPVRRGACGGPPRRAPAALRARGLGKRYEELVAVDDVSLDLRPGTITALVGPNGSGKTTVLRMLAGSVAPDAGTIEVPHDAVARTLQATAVFPTLTPLEHLLAASGGRRRHGGLVRSVLATPKARAEERAFVGWARGVLDRFGLPADLPAGELPVSDQRALMLATAYATGATVLLVDEPAAGASAFETTRIGDLLRSLRDEGLTLLVVEHNAALVRRLADTVVSLDAGRVT